jgi:hypothetical protein
VSGSFTNPVCSDKLSRLSETRAFPHVDDVDSVQDRADRLGVSRIGTIAADSLLIDLPLRFPCAPAGQKLLVSAHACNLRTGSRIGPPPTPYLCLAATSLEQNLPTVFLVCQLPQWSFHAEPPVVLHQSVPASLFH